LQNNPAAKKPLEISRVAGRKAEENGNPGIIIPLEILRGIKVPQHLSFVRKIRNSSYFRGVPRNGRQARKSARYFQF